MIRQEPIGSNLLNIGGIFIIIFSVVVGSLVLFVIPGACSFVSSLLLLILGFFLLVGVLTFLTGKVLSRRNKRGKPG